MGLIPHRERVDKGRAGQRGFTLIEVLVVLVIAGIALGLISLNAMPGERQALQREGQRLALLLQLARDEAIVRNRPVAFEAEADRYRFLLYDERQWRVMARDELLRERAFDHAPLVLTLAPAAASAPLRIVFGREPVDRPFVLTLSSGAASVAIRADGVGRFSVE